MNSEDVQTFIEALACKEAAELGAQRAAMPGGLMLRYAHDLSWHWPRRFDYRVECFLSDVDDDLVLQQMPHEPHVINLFHEDSERRAQALETFRYELAWISPLMGKTLKAGEDAAPQRRWHSSADERSWCSTPSPAATARGSTNGWVG